MEEERGLAGETLVVPHVSAGQTVSVTGLALSVLCYRVSGTRTDTLVFAQIEVLSGVAAGAFQRGGPVTGFTVSITRSALPRGINILTHVTVGDTDCSLSVQVFSRTTDIHTHVGGLLEVVSTRSAVPGTGSCAAETRVTVAVTVRV